MTAIILVSLLVCLLGAIAYLVASSKPLRDRIAQLGYAAFAMGLLVTLLAVAHKVVKL